MRFVNTDSEARPRSWNSLVNADTLTTLELAPGESADVLEWREVYNEDGTVVGVELFEPEADAFPFLERVAAPAQPAQKSAAVKEPAGEPSQPSEE